MIPPRLTPGGTIGLCSPSHIALGDDYQKIKDGLRSIGFKVREAENLYKNTWGYLASPMERAADFNQLIADPDVELVFFGGGEGSAELLPYIDFDNIRRHPKCILSYSDGTTILNPVWSRTGLVTYYGQSPQMFMDPSQYDYQHFSRHLILGDVREHMPASRWQIQTPGTGEGILTGGYSRNFAMLLGSPYFSWDPGQKYLLFLEDHQSFGGVDYVGAMLANIEQHPFSRCVSGVIFGHYSEDPCPWLLKRLERMGQVLGVPVVYCDDFGHGSSHGILPIGVEARLTTDPCCLKYL